MLRVKGSGSDLKTVQKKDFPGVRMDDVSALLERPDMGDSEMVDYLRFALQDPGGSRPSIETLLHGFLPAEAVFHTHADAVVSLTNNDECGRRPTRSLRRRGGGAALSPARLPDLPRGGRQRSPRGRVSAPCCWRSTGTICWGASVKEAYLATIELISRAEEAIAHRAKGRTRFGGGAVTSPAADERRRVALAVAPHLRGLVGREPPPDRGLRRRA